MHIAAADISFVLENLHLIASFGPSPNDWHQTAPAANDALGAFSEQLGERD